MHAPYIVLFGVCSVILRLIHGIPPYPSVERPLWYEKNLESAIFVGPKGNPIVIRVDDVNKYPPLAVNVSADYDNDVKFYLYTKKTPHDPQRLLVNNATSFKSSDFDPSKSTKFLIHGYSNDVSSPMIQENKNEFLSNYDYNIIAVDWSALSSTVLFPLAVAHVPAVGSFVAQLILFMNSQDFSKPSTVHLIGHSLGAHVAGIAGKVVQKEGYNVSRISGLDAALLGFAYSTPSQRLMPSDADYVDCIHTTGGFIGFSIPICQADYYPNGGQDPQPGCYMIDFGACSHLKSYEYYAESINSTNVFSAESCAGLKKGVPESCVAEGAVMGYPAGQKKYQGVYYLQTDPNAPYAKG